jgi:hypothetical protein
LGALISGFRVKYRRSICLTTLNWTLRLSPADAASRLGCAFRAMRSHTRPAACRCGCTLPVLTSAHAHTHVFLSSSHPPVRTCILMCFCVFNACFQDHIILPSVSLSYQCIMFMYFRRACLKLLGYAFTYLKAVDLQTVSASKLIDLLLPH